MLEQWTKIPLKHKVPVAVVIYVLIGVGFYMYLYSDTAEKSDKEAARHKEIIAKLNTLKNISDNPKEFESKLRKLKELVGDFENRCPESSKMEDFLRLVSKEARDMGLRILSFHQRAEMGMGFYAQIPVYLKVLGSYRQVSDFFERIGNLKRIVNIENIQFQRFLAGQREMEEKLLVECTMTACRYIKQAPPGDAQKK